MRDLTLFRVVLFLALAVILFVPSGVHNAIGQPVGLVCLSPSTNPNCPAAPVTISSQVGTQLSVAVLVQGSDAFSGFDITLKANHTILTPVDAITTGSLLSGGSTIVKCIGGVLKTGPTCLPTDTADTIHIATVGPPDFLTSSPTTGLLFTAVYNVTGTSTIPVSYQTGCAMSSVNGTSTCVLFSNGSILPPLETVQGATYTQAPTPTFSIGISGGQSSITILKGGTGNLTILLFSINRFSGNVAMSVALTPATKHPPSISLSSRIVALTSGGSGSDLLTASAANNADRGAYVITVTASSGSETGSLQIPLSVTSR